MRPWISNTLSRKTAPSCRTSRSSKARCCTPSNAAPDASAASCSPSRARSRDHLRTSDEGGGGGMLRAMCAYAKLGCGWALLRVGPTRSAAECRVTCLILAYAIE
eukprot:4771545-Prymnesium_polylepis.1